MPDDSAALPPRLVELRPPGPGGSEVTLYVKGFLGRGEAPEHFGAWLESHRQLQARLFWAPHALGWRWEAGQLERLPLPLLSAGKLGLDVLRRVRTAQRVNLIGAAGSFLAEEAIRLAFGFARQYAAAARSARSRAEELALALAELAGRHERVRLVAHSLGCLHAIEAVARLPAPLRPHEIHLCAPACHEEAVADRLGGLARERCFLYYASGDRVLDLAFLAVARQRALGVAGPRQAYPGLRAVDVGEHFGFFVHNEYKRRFADFAANSETPLQIGAGSGAAPP